MFLFYSPQDIEQFKAEIEKRQLKDLPIPDTELAGPSKEPEKNGTENPKEITAES